MTSRTTRTPQTLVAVTVLALALAACGGTGPSDADRAALEDDRSTDGEAQTDQSPLEAYFSAFSGPEAEKRRMADERRVQELVSECMTAEGFDYTPLEPTPAYESQGAPADLTVETAQQYGWGFTTGQEAEVEDHVDPNDAYVSAMSPNERGAYDLALYGAEHLDPDGELEEIESGCYGQAFDEVFADRNAILENELFLSIQVEMAQVLEQAAVDGRLAEPSTAWSDCMADRGHPGFTEVDDAYVAFTQEMMALDDQYGADEIGGGDPAMLQTARAELRPKEIDMAVADVTCREQSGYAETERKIVREYEQKFLDDNHDELEELLVLLNEAGY